MTRREGPELRWKSPLNAAIIQTELHPGEPDLALSEACSLIDEACREGGADLLVLPEMFATGFPYERLGELSKGTDNILRVVGEKALEHGVGIIFTASVRENGHFRNRLFFIDRDGSTAGTYDKTHLFSRSGEDDFFTRGDTLRLFSWGDVDIGPLICYEVRFPELSRLLVLEGAAILVYPAQWPRHRTFQWENFLRTRALENQCFVMGANVYGDHGGAFMGGHSMIVSPYGRTVGHVKSGPGWAVSRLDPSSIRRFRKGIPVLGDIRKDLTVERIVTSPL
ncbi:hypothetical protein B6U90_05185 [Thermoplasmatales archaeon ex4484_6]|nr:MAG: hypothetical protein B6U90_05185 [Thermoplasmatales archaeon ex4484_6]RLF69393.1 MAG: hypothetical protein DRN57_00800 [Thermoplasmata archaeon]